VNFELTHEIRTKLPVSATGYVKNRFILLFQRPCPTLFLQPPLLLTPPSPSQLPNLAAMASLTEAGIEEIEPQTGRSEDVGAIPIGFDADPTSVAASKGILQGWARRGRGLDTARIGHCSSSLVF
jgi:hypothetical protein